MTHLENDVLISAITVLCAFALRLVSLVSLIAKTYRITQRSATTTGII
jgi:hypothetical protein